MVDPGGTVEAFGGGDGVGQFGFRLAAGSTIDDAAYAHFSKPHVSVVRCRPGQEHGLSGGLLNE